MRLLHLLLAAIAPPSLIPSSALHQDLPSERTWFSDIPVTQGKRERFPRFTQWEDIDRRFKQDLALPPIPPSAYATGGSSDVAWVLRELCRPGSRGRALAAAGFDGGAMWVGVTDSRLLENDLELIVEMLHESHLLSAHWNPEEAGPEDGLFEERVAAVPEGWADSPCWRDKKGSKVIHQAAIFVPVDLKHLLRIEKNIDLCLDDAYVYPRDVEEVTIKHIDYLTSLDPKKRDVLYSKVECHTGIDKLPDLPTITLKILQRREQDGSVSTQYFANSSGVHYLVGADTIIPLELEGRTAGCFVASKLAYELDYFGPFDGVVERLEGPAARQEVMRQQLGNWKRLAELSIVLSLPLAR